MALVYLDTIIAFVVILLGVSLLITILNQMISALLSSRGTNLLWGVQTLLSTVEPELAGQSKTLATELLKKPILSDSVFSKFEDGSLLGSISTNWRLATAVTAEDLIHGLRNLADGVEATDPKKAKLIHELLAETDPELQNKAAMLQKALSGLSPKYALQVDKIVQQIETSAQTSVGKLEAWFNIVMKRTSQRFALQMRIWTIVFAFLIAFGTHMDSFKIVRQLWTSPGLRSGLVSEREAIIGEAAMVLSSKDGTAQPGAPSLPPQLLADAMKKLIDSEKEATAGLGATPRFNSLEEAVRWLSTGLKVDENRKQVIIGEYNNLVLTELKERAGRIDQELEKAGFKLQLATSWKELICYDGLSNILGILASAAFLSLGAPFWFNALKTLSNLRPLVATQQKEK